MRRAVNTQGGPIVVTPIRPSRELLCVLIVDDYRAAADTMSMLVGVWGHDVRRAYDGITGWRWPPRTSLMYCCSTS